MNTNASELFGLDKQWALIYVDENEKFVALKPLEIKESRAIPVKKSGGKNSNSSSRVINSKTLVKRILGVATKKVRKFEVSWSAEDACLIIDLNKEI